MRAWQGDHQNVRASYEKWVASRKQGPDTNEKVGGCRQPSVQRAKSAPPDRLVLPSAIGRGRERLQLDANKELRRDQAWLDALAAEAVTVMSKLSEGTRAGWLEAMVSMAPHGQQERLPHRRDQGRAEG